MKTEIKNNFMFIDKTTKLTFGKYKGKCALDKVIPLSYWEYLQSRPDITLCQYLTNYITHYTSHRLPKSIDKNYVSSNWTPNTCSRCGTIHTMACDHS